MPKMRIWNLKTEEVGGTEKKGMSGEETVEHDQQVRHPQDLISARARLSVPPSHSAGDFLFP